jgi:hypothetical protein
MVKSPKEFICYTLFTINKATPKPYIAGCFFSDIVLVMLVGLLIGGLLTGALLVVGLLVGGLLGGGLPLAGLAISALSLPLVPRCLRPLRLRLKQVDNINQSIKHTRCKR